MTRGDRNHGPPAPGRRRKRLHAAAALLGALALLATLDACLIVDAGPDHVLARQDADSAEGDGGASDVASDGHAGDSPDSLADSDTDLDLSSLPDGGQNTPLYLCDEDERRCFAATVEECGDDRRSWIEREVCLEGTVCQRGACIALPDGYGDFCLETAACPGELECVDGRCLTHAPGDAGVACYDHFECREPAWCNGLGYCTEADAGDGCGSDADCGRRAPFCDANDRCSTGLVGSACAVAAQCEAGLRCGPQGACQRGEEGDACYDSALHCGPQAPICGPRDRCQDGGTAGDPCASTIHCQAGSECVEGLCAVAGENEPCDTAADCPETAPICGPAERCSAGTRGRACDAPSDCVAPFVCGPDGVCQSGYEGEPCDGASDCGPAAPLCVGEACQDGSRDDPCQRKTDCGVAPFCSPDGTCQPGLDGDPCTADSHCDDDADYFCTSRSECDDGATGDPCTGPDDCGQVAPYCISEGWCESGLEGARCTAGAECAGAAPHCVAEHCFDGSLGDPCRAGSDCAPAAPRCGPQGCQRGAEGDPCLDAAACAPLAPFCGPDRLCHDGGVGDPCASHTQCVGASPLCGPAGCQDGSEGDPCANGSQCAPEARYCGRNATCHNGSQGDPCASDSQCLVAFPQCGPAGCQLGVEGDPCDVGADCGASAPSCGRFHTCHDGSAGDPCALDAECQAGVPLCGPAGCQDGSQDDPCDAPSHCGATTPFCGEGLCSSGTEGRLCDGPEDCAALSPICGPAGCQDGAAGDPCEGADDCGSETAFCIDGQCADGREGDPCLTALDCDATAPICGPAGCQDGSERDVCFGPEYCGPTAPLCGPDFKCHDGREGDPCLPDESQCASEAPICGPDYRCQDGSEGDACSAPTDCTAGSAICGPDGCQDGNEGDACSSGADCNGSAPRCGPGRTCQDGSAGDSCAVPGDCSGAAPLCGPAGCQRGLEGDLCDGPEDCAAPAPFCGAAYTCHDGSPGDPCAAADQCQPAVPYCGPGGCQSGLEGQPCDAANDCAPSAPLCGPAGCQDGAVGDPCTASLHCVSPLTCGDGACTCATGYYGPACDACDCNGSPCDDGVGGDGACICRAGFFGPDCTQSCDCNSSPCDDGADGSGACFCRPDTFGADCSGTCGCVWGECADGASGDGACTCDPGAYGPNCDQVCACPLSACDDGPDGSGCVTPRFAVQRGTVVMANGATSLTLTAGSGYTAPAGPAFVRLVSTRSTGMGLTSGGGKQDADRWMVWVDAPNLQDRMVFRRFDSADDCRVTWEIVQYSGPPVGPNAMRVHQAGTLAFGTGALTDRTPTLTGVADPADVVVFVTGQALDMGGAGSKREINQALFTAEWLAADGRAELTRGESGQAATVSYAIVELTGANWSVQRVAFDHTLAGSVETTAIASVGDVSRAFLHAQVRSTSGDVPDLGAAVWLSSPIALSFERAAAASGTARSVVWVVTNAETGVGRMVVDHYAAFRFGGAAEEDVWTEAINPVADVARTSIVSVSGWASSGEADGAPQGAVDLRLTATNRVELRQSDNNGARSYRYSVVQWPAD